MAPNLSDVSQKRCDIEVPAEWALEEKTPGSGSFKAREPMVTQEELRSVDAALAAKKASASYRDLSDHHALEMQQHRGGGL